MNTWLRACAVMLLLAGAAGAGPDGGQLVPGSPAPALTDVTWLQGEPIPAWTPGSIYVLDFWATWCGPCRESIPHLNDLAAALGERGVKVIGVAIWPRQGMVPTADFVKQKGKAMSYPIAEDVGGRTATAFMTAAGRKGIPTVMIVDGAGKLAWMGHPMKGLTEEIARLVPGFDAAAFDRQRLAREQELRALFATLKTAEEAGDWAGFAATSATVAELDAARYGQFLIYGYQALLKLEDKAAAAEYGRRAVEGPLKDSAEPLNLFAWSLVDPDSAIPAAERDLPLARLAVLRADELSQHKDPSVLDTLARVQFLAGEFTEAVATQREALALTLDDAMRTELQRRLDEYLRAAPKS